MTDAQKQPAAAGSHAGEPAPARLRFANALLRAISDLQSRFIGNAPMGALFKGFVAHLVALTDSAYGFVGEVMDTPDGVRYFKIQALSDGARLGAAADFYLRTAPIGLEFYDLDNVFGAVLDSGRAVIVDAQTRAPTSRHRLPEGHPPCAALLALPIGDERGVLGLVGLADRPGGYDFALAEALGPLLATCANLIAASRARQWREEAESELRRQALVFEHMSDAVLLTDRDAVILDCNRAVPEMLGLPRKRLLGTRLESLLATDGPGADTVRAATTAAERGQRWSGIVPVRHGARGDRAWETTLLPLRDALEQDGTLLWVGRDVTERQAARRTLEARTRELNAIADLSPDGFVFIDQAGCISYVNPSFERMIGLGREELLGVAAERLEQAIAARCTPGEVVRTAGATILHLARPRFTIIKRTESSLHDGDGQLRGIVHYYRDITREAEVDRMKSEFLTTAAHELRTPMASVLGFAELLMNPDVAAEKQRRFAEIIHRQAGQLVTLVNELLDLARIEARRGKDFVIGEHRLVAIVHDALADFSMPGDTRKVELVLPRRSPHVMVDADKLKLALVNVLNNAFKYSLGKGAVELRVSTRRAGTAREVAIIVRDEGIGMTAEQSSRVFERFYRADSACRIPGTGLGMSIVKEVMDIFRGTVEIASRPGCGTTVALWLPASTADGAAGGPE